MTASRNPVLHGLLAAARRLLCLIAVGLLLLAGGVDAAGLTQIRLFGFDEDQGLVVLYANAPMTARAFHLSSPERWVVDIPNAHYNDSTTTLGGIKGTPIRRIRAAQFKGGVLRIVFDLDRYAEFPQELTNPGPDNYRLSFRVAPGKASAAAHPTPVPEVARPTPRPPLKTPRVPLVLRPAPQPTRAPVSFARAHEHEEANGPSGLSLHRVGG
ncbi:MAG TPA: AMIN domain-containing protein, partial [Stenomitos sp.]